MSKFVCGTCGKEPCSLPMDLAYRKPLDYLWLEAVAEDLEAGRYVYDEDQYYGLVNKDEL